jgi:hypothetical protein
MWLTDLADVARSTGLPVIEVPGWRTRGHAPMTDVRTIICHHTAGPATGNYPSLGVVRDGRSDLPGPLAQLGLARDGTVYVIAAGLCYHAGESRDPSYTNSHSIGIEAEATGITSWPAAQMDAYARLVRALADHYHVPLARVLGHKETCAPVGRKSDPNFDMGSFRARVTAIQEDDMPDPKDLWSFPVPRPGNTDQSAGYQVGAANVNSYRAWQTSQQVLARVAAMEAALAAIAKSGTAGLDMAAVQAAAEAGATAALQHAAALITQGDHA